MLRAKQPPLIITESADRGTVAVAARRRRSVMPIAAALVTVGIVAGGIARRGAASLRPPPDVGPTPGPAPVQPTAVQTTPAPVMTGSAADTGSAGSAVQVAETPSQTPVVPVVVPPRDPDTRMTPRQTRPGRRQAAEGEARGDRTSPSPRSRQADKGD